MVRAGRGQGRDLSLPQNAGGGGARGSKKKGFSKVTPIKGKFNRR